jgi:hypothetical protein
LKHPCPALHRAIFPIIKTGLIPCTLWPFAFHMFHVLHYGHPKRTEQKHACPVFIVEIAESFAKSVLFEAELMRTNKKHF